MGANGIAVAFRTRPLGALGMSAAKMNALQTDTPRKRLEYVFGETAKGNGQPFLDALAEDAEWTVIGSPGWARPYRGKAAILGDLVAPLRRARARPRGAPQDPRAPYDRRGQYGCRAGTGRERYARWQKVREHLLLGIRLSGRAGGGGD